MCAECASLSGSCFWLGGRGQPIASLSEADVDHAAGSVEAGLEKEAAAEVRRLALHAIESLSAILRMTAIVERPECYGDLRRAVGSVIGKTDFSILAKLHGMFPDPGDLGWALVGGSGLC